MDYRTAELCDRFSSTRHLMIGEPLLRSFGGNPRFHGPISTAKVFEDHALIETILQEQGNGRILVIDGGGSHRCGLLDAETAAMAAEKGWQGILIYGCIRNAPEIRELRIGVLALHSHPLRSHARGTGERDVLITFAGINFRQGHFLYADEDGVVVCDTPLEP